ncbi:unnamed protein product [Adineta steineri]|uniref:NHL repeat containing protein n=1 Tax=Adineta steineri TaxID=433720 RepID=A0A815MZG8_9BILA|nr:unnamed protein product [Adineta steineri]CAF3862325.1 unnamed protein product [Adineta steineri]
MSSLKEFLRNLNLFSPSSDSNEQENDQQRRWNIIGTRIYIILIIFILFIVGLILLLLKQRVIVTIPNPTKEQFEGVPNNAKCSCSHISIPYRKFMSLKTSFHQVCSSDFVTNRWLNAIDSKTNTTYFGFRDFRRIGNAQFQALAAYCRLSESYTNQSVYAILQNALLSPQILSNASLQSYINATIEQFKLKTPNTFNIQLKLIIKMAVANKLIPALQTSSYYIDDMLEREMYAHNYRRTNGSTCYCNQNDCNQIESGIVNKFGKQNVNEAINSLAWSIPGMSTGCFPGFSLLWSTLECFYNQTCVDKLISYFPTSEEFNAMIMNNESLYLPTSTVQSIIDKLMIENWTMNIFYDEYYSECAPSSCTYLKIFRRDFGHVLKKLIGLLSSLTLILGLIIPLVIGFIMKRRDRTPKPRISFKNRLYQLKEIVQKKLIELNIFKHSSNTDRQTKFQRYATRLYIFLLIGSMIIITIYVFLQKSIQSKTISYPTESQFIQLEEKYSRSLSCPCSSISISYSSFTTIQPQYHQLCRSDLISEEWIHYMKKSLYGKNLINFDYRLVSTSYFQLLSLFCEQARETIVNALEIFLKTEFVSSQVLEQELFKNQINSATEDWKLTATNTFRRTIQLIQRIYHGNQLIGSLNTGLFYTDENLEVYGYPQTHYGCDCIVSPSCYSTVAIYRTIQYNVYSDDPYLVPNIFYGCDLILSLFESTLECFYNLSCMLEIDEHIGSPVSFNFSALNQNLSQPNEKIEKIINRLMIDKWLPNVNFSSYYKKCLPLSCTYQYDDRNNIFISITTIISIFGGLSLALKLLIMISLEFINKILTNNFFHLISFSFIKQIFICRTENQIIHRLHVILVIGILTTFYMFSAFTPRVIPIEINKPSLKIYEDLYKEYNDTLKCPCSQLSMKYESFLTLTPRFHEVCSSEFITDRWLSYLYKKKHNDNRYSAYDFYSSAVGQFKLLSSFCNLSKETVSESIFQLETTDFINNQLLSSYILNSRIEMFINEFQQTISQSFVNSISLIRETINSNMLMTLYLSNWKFDRVTFEWSTAVIYMFPLNYTGCSCSSSSKCVSSSHGMLIGCYPLETIFQTTLHCFYDQQCIDSTHNFKSINTSSLEASHFLLNQTIESVVNKLMLEELKSEINYTNYFDACSPALCIYSYVDKTNAIEGILALIGLYGGLVIICRLIAIIIVKKMCRPRSVNSDISETQPTQSTRSCVCIRSKLMWIIFTIVIIAIITIPTAIILTKKGNVVETNLTTAIMMTTGEGSTTLMLTTTKKPSTTTTTTVEPGSTTKAGSSCNSSWSTAGITLLSSSTKLSCTRLFIDSDDTLYGADKDRHYIWKVSKNAENATVVAGVHGSSGSDSIKLNYPEDVYVDRYGSIYALDTNNHRVQKFINGTTHAITIAGLTESPGCSLKQFNYPRGFAFDPTDTFMYIADRSCHRVVRFSTSSTSGTDRVLAAGTARPGNTSKALNGPWSIWYLSSINNDLLIVNHDGNSVIRWPVGGTSGTFVAGLPGSTCSNSTCFSGPTDVKIDADLNMYVVDEKNHRVQMFCKDSNVGVTVIGNDVPGNSPTQLNSPRGIAFDSAMNMYVCDTGNQRVQKFLKL